MRKKILQLLCCLTATYTASAQDTAVADLSNGKAERSAIDLYYAYTGNEARLYNGIGQILYDMSIKGNAYFLSDKLQHGEVMYDGLLFKDVFLQYDIYKDEVSVKHFRGFTFTLLKEKLPWFDLEGHHFVRHIFSPKTTSSLPTGFYEHVYEGKTAVVIKRAKVLDKKVTDVLEQQFLPHDSYYILKDNLYHSCNSYRRLLSILSDKSKYIRRYLRKNKIKFRKNPEEAVVLSAQFYDLKN